MKHAICLLLLIASSLPAESSPALAAELPASVRQHMAKMVGQWSFEGVDGDRRFRGKEAIRLTSNGTALLQEGYFELPGGGKEHYVILSGWDASGKTVRVRGFTSDGYSWTGEWKTLNGSKWQGTASGNAASFAVEKDTMRYEDAGDGKPWISRFTRIKKQG